ncbi:MAG: (Fe-S)-binding protein [Candidatus Helarchaeota archaeon]
MLENYSDMVNRCLRCSMCKWIPQLQIKSKEFASICPSIDYYNFHTYSGGGRLILANSLLTKRIELTKEVAEIIYSCTLCGGCAISCKYMNTLEIDYVIQSLREKTVESGQGPLPKHQEYIEKTKINHNPYGGAHEDRFAWLPDDIEISENSSTVYYVGCTSSYRRKEIAIATARVLNAAGVKFSILREDEFCCGSPLIRVGAKKEFEKLAEHNLSVMKKKKAKQVIMSCAGCYSTFKVEYPRIKKYGFKLMHSSEFFDKLIRKNKLELRTEVPLTVTYHDPCHLGRCSEREPRWLGIELEVRPLVKLQFPPKPLRWGAKGVYDPPRNILKQIPGLKLIEMERIKEYSYCCGAGGGVKACLPDFALHTAKNRVKEATNTNAEALVSACPFCSTNLQDAIQDLRSPMKFYDISELIYKAL